MSIHSIEFRRALGRFATGVAVVTTLDQTGQPVGVTVNSFSALSLDPPLVLFCLDQASESLQAYQQAGHFAVNLLREDQRDLSVAFAGNTPTWPGYERWSTGSPVFRDCLANLDCETEVMHDGGDHVILVGRVVRLARGEPGRPLLFYDGRYVRLNTVAGD